MAQPDPLAFGKALKRAMAAAEVSRVALAETVGVNVATVSQWRRGAFLPDADKRPAIATALKTTEADLFGMPSSQSGELSRDERVWLAEFEVRLYKEYGASTTEVEAAKSYVLATAKPAESFMATAQDVGMREMAGFRFAGSVVRRELQRRRDAEAEAPAIVRERLRSAAETGDAQTGTRTREGSG